MKAIRIYLEKYKGNVYCYEEVYNMFACDMY